MRLSGTFSPAGEMMGAVAGVYKSALNLLNPQNLINQACGEQGCRFGEGEKRLGSQYVPGEHPQKQRQEVSGSWRRPGPGMWHSQPAGPWKLGLSTGWRRDIPQEVSPQVGQRRLLGSCLTHRSSRASQSAGKTGPNLPSAQPLVLI